MHDSTAVPKRKLLASAARFGISEMMSNLGFENPFVCKTSPSVGRTIREFTGGLGFDKTTSDWPQTFEKWEQQDITGAPIQRPMRC